MMKLFKHIALVLFAIINISYASEFSINKIDAKDWANNKGQELLLVLSEANLANKYAKLDEMLIDYVNIDYVSKFVIGKYARVMTLNQKKLYSQLFQRYILSSYKQVNLSFDASLVKFTIDDVIEHPQFTTVKCTVDVGELLNNSQDALIPIKFKLIRGASNNIQVVDLEIANVSMVIEYRKRIYKMIEDEDGDIDWFLDKFDDKVRANEENIYKNATL